MDKNQIPRHTRMGDYLAVHHGTFAEDDSDGLGPGWTSWDPAIHGTREEVEAAVTAWAATYVPPEQAAAVARAAKLAALTAAKDSLEKASTVAGVKTAAAAAIEALEARVAALEGKWAAL